MIKWPREKCWKVCTGKHEHKKEKNIYIYIYMEWRDETRIVAAERTEQRQQELHWVRRSRCFPGVREASEYRKLYECEARIKNKAGDAQRCQQTLATSSRQLMKNGLGERRSGKTNGERHRLCIGRHQTHTRRMGKERLVSALW